MPSTRDIRRRIKSVKNTSQITKAMQMVAASKMRKAQQVALASRPYSTLLDEILAPLASSFGDISHPLMEVREVKKRLVILVSSDKGLCGALNSNLMREAAKFDRTNTVFITAGRKASQFIARTKRELAAEFTYRDAPLFSEARAIAKFAVNMFNEGKVDRVDVLYTRFFSTLNQKPEAVQVLPIGEIKPHTTGLGGDAAAGAHAVDSQGATEFIYEPNQGDVLGALLPHSLNFQIYHILLEAKASEQSARMVAMKNATDNAKQLIKDLTLEYNKLRQANITRELLEITSAAMAMG
jgi:F-type H+-transporting ATPase subunit gamma